MERQRLVRLFKAQIAALRAVDPEGLGKAFGSINTARYEELLDLGPKAKWPAGLLPGLRQGIRDCHNILLLAYGTRRNELFARLRKEAGTAVDLLVHQDSVRLDAMLKRGRIRTPDEYYLARARLDQLEIDDANPIQQAELRGLIDEFAVA